MDIRSLTNARQDAGPVSGYAKRGQESECPYASSLNQAGIAQSVEQLIRNEKVVGSIPISGTISMGCGFGAPLTLKA